MPSSVLIVSVEDLSLRIHLFFTEQDKKKFKKMPCQTPDCLSGDKIAVNDTHCNGCAHMVLLLTAVWLLHTFWFQKVWFYFLFA